MMPAFLAVAGAAPIVAELLQQFLPRKSSSKTPRRPVVTLAPTPLRLVKLER